MSQVIIDQTMQIASQHHQAGRLREAEQLYRQVLARVPGHPPALHRLGLIAFQAGRFEVAVDLFRQAVALGLNLPEAHSQLGNALISTGSLDEAIAAYRQAIALRPEYAEAHSNLGNALRDKGQLDEAIAACGKAIALRADYAEAYTNLGNALKDKGRLDEAIAAYRRAVALRPGLAPAHSNLGDLLRETGDLDEAIAACEQAIALMPNHAEAHNNLGNALLDQGQLDEALAAYRRAVALRPGYVQAHSNLGNALKGTGLLDEAIAAYRQAVGLDSRLAGADSNLVYALHFHPGYDSAGLAGEQRRWNGQHARGVRKLGEPPGNDRAPDRRLKIGYVSADFRNHVVGRNVLPLFREHDHARFEIHCYSNVPRPDELTARFRSHADVWRSIVGLSDEQAAELVREDRIDVLVDLSLHLAGNRLLVFAGKPAPVQVTFAEYPGTTGLDGVNYRLTDPYLDPPGQGDEFYAERSIRLPESFWCYDPTVMTDGTELGPRASPLPALSAGQVTFGCLNNFCKVNDQVLARWARVLKAVAGSRLVLMAPPGSARQRTLEVMVREGVDPVRIQFVDFASTRQYLETYRRIDIGLDTLPYNGHTTSLDALWMGVPVVTLVGSTVVGRAGLSQLTNLGLTELVATSDDRYVRIAAELAGDLTRLTGLRASLRQRMRGSVLTDAPRFARNVEAAYRELWRRWCQ